jgi:hypothetical protein
MLMSFALMGAHQSFLRRQLRFFEGTCKARHCLQFSGKTGSGQTGQQTRPREAFVVSTFPRLATKSLTPHGERRNSSAVKRHA